MPSWVVARERSRLRWGGDLRRHYILSALGSLPGAVEVDGWSVAVLRPVLPARVDGDGMDRPCVAAATLLPDPVLDLVRDRAIPGIVDVHDDPVAQTRALGLTPDPEWVETTLARRRRNTQLFRLAIAPSPGIAAIAELDPERTIIAGNGTDPSIVTGDQPWPAEPVIGMCAGAAPGRGIEALIEAARLLRADRRMLRLRLWLAGTGADSEAYLSRLRAVVAPEPWIEIISEGYREVAAALGTVTVHCIPTPAAEYWDLVSPIKLFDAMASARPVVVTPRREMAADVRAADAGAVAEGDDAEALAAALARVLDDETGAQRMGANGRRAALERHDWRRIAQDVATRTLEAIART
jgi:glycosyltransferase involved in cell wall biosynthesis